MGSEKVILPTRQQAQQFVVDVLRDIQALDQMIQQDLFEKDVTRIGAEQELCLVDENWKPAMLNMQVLEKANNPFFTTEVAQFNLETNVAPRIFEGKCLSSLEAELVDFIEKLRVAAKSVGADVLLTGILPTIRKVDLTINNLTPLERYKALCEALAKTRGTEEVELNIRGIDELITMHDSPIMEGCNTGFQVHLQVRPEEFAAKYNAAQAIAGPALAIGTNSPLLFGKRLWHETRIALFQQAVDVRVKGENLRERSARVMFGNGWIKNSILEIYKEDITRFQALLANTEKEDPFLKLANGELPSLEALGVHNSTVYRWNRPCFGKSGDKFHLRIENRVLPSGPTVQDEIANAALWLGLVNGLTDVYGDVSKKMPFEKAKINFVAACRNGMNNKFWWLDSKKPVPASELLAKTLIPIAKEGLKKANVAKEDIDRYLGILEGRCETGQTGSQWTLDAYAKLSKETSRKEALVALTACMSSQQKTNKPVHEWSTACMKHLDNWTPSAMVTEDFMQTNIFTVREEDTVELVAQIMDWEKIKYVPVEDANGKLVGLMTTRIIRRHLLKHYYNRHTPTDAQPIAVKALMITNPTTIEPEASIVKAIKLMQDHDIGCLPVVKKGELLGIITEQDFIQVSSQLTYRFFKAKGKPKNGR